MNLLEAIAYNAKRRKDGKFTDEHEAMLVAFLQEYAPAEVLEDLAADGKLGTDGVFDKDAKFGDEGVAVLTASFRKFARAEPPPEPTPLPAPPASGSRFALAFLATLRAEVGHGEDGWDNSGPDINRYRDLPDPSRPRNLGSYAHWCAFFQIYCIRQAFAKLGRPDDARFALFHDDKNGGRLMPIGGARDLVYRAATSKHGKWVARKGKILEPLMPGDLVAIAYNDDPNERHGQGHVFALAALYGGPDKVDTIEGNLGKYPALVKYRRRNLLDLGKSTRLLQAARLS